MTIKSILLGARRGTGLAEEILRAKSPEDARGVAGSAWSKSVANKAGLRWMPVTIPLVRNSIGEEVEQPFLGSMANGQRDKAARRRGRSWRAVIPILLAGFTLSPARAVSPPPDGGYPFFNTAEGDNALASLTTGADNTANGFNALVRNTGGNDNTAIGFNALSSNTTGIENTATGAGVLQANTTGVQNTAIGGRALFNNTTGANNTAIGDAALALNTTGGSNTASGFSALSGNTTGGNNTANGFQALSGNTTGGNNTANGFQALFGNTTGGNNTASGFDALANNTTGSFNAAIGVHALLSNSTGRSNIALGRGAGKNLTTGNNNIDIDNPGIGGDSNIIRIGTVGRQNATFIAGVRGDTVASGVGVIVGTDGQLGTISSSERFKEAVKPMDKASEAILALKPVTFRYKHELDPAGIPQFGLVAEQVEKVNPVLVARDGQGKVNTVRYEAVNAMLLNEFLKEHRKVQDLEAAIAQQQKDFARQQKEVKALAASLKEQALQIQKVSGRLEVSKPAPQTAAGG